MADRTGHGMLADMSSPAALPVPARVPACRAWSAHAEDLARELTAHTRIWRDDATARSNRHHGDVHELRPGVFVPVAYLTSMADRAVAVGCALGDQLRASFVIAGRSAAWVCLGGPPPAEIDLVTLARPHALAGVRMREAPLGREDVEAIGGCPVTVPGRTVVDLLRYAPDAAAAAAMLEHGLVDEDDVRRRLDALDGRPHARQARARWAELLSGPRASRAA